MYQRTIILFFLFFFQLFTIYAQNPPADSKVPSHFSDPVDIPIFLSGNYGEIRAAHFHAGIDIKTQQTEGKHVLAADSGYVFRVAVQSGGYGRVVYLKHPGGIVTVYGHLREFEPALGKFVKEQQYRKKSYEVNLFPEAGQLTYRKGQLIGLSGNSGSSGGPHLHFEVRDKSASVPFNPLNYGFSITDRTKPEIRWLMIYPLDRNSRVNGAYQKWPAQVINQNGRLRVYPDTIQVSGNIGIGIETYDFLDHSANECTPYTLGLLVDGRLHFFCRIDSIPFELTGYINSHIDYEEKMISGRKIQKMFLDPNNQLGIYKVAVNRGVLPMHDQAIHDLQIIVRDTHGNESTLLFWLKAVPATEIPEINDKDSLVVRRFAYNDQNVFENPDIRVIVPRKSLFRDIDFQYACIPNDSFQYSPIHQVHNLYTPVLGSYTLSIKPDNLPEKLYDKALIAGRGPKGTWISEGGEYKNGYVTTRATEFGQFIIMVDTVAPDIQPVRFKAEATYAENDLISFRVADTLSGIQEYAGYIDKNWALFEYDAKNDLLLYTIDGRRLVKNQIHRLEIQVSDEKKNTAKFRSSFYY